MQKRRTIAGDMPTPKAAVSPAYDNASNLTATGDSSNKLFRSIDNTRVQAQVSERPQCKFFLLSAGVVVASVSMMAFALVSVTSTPREEPFHRLDINITPATWWNPGRTRHQLGVAKVEPKLEPKLEQPGSSYVAKAALLDNQFERVGLQHPTTSFAEGPVKHAHGPMENFAGGSGRRILRRPVPTLRPTTTGETNVPHDGATPVHYVIEIRPNLEQAQNFSFSGSVTITFACRVETQRIALHAAASLMVTVSNVVATFRTIQKPLHVGKTWRDAIGELFVIHLKETLHKNERYNITLNFAGTIGEEPRGLYRVSYHDTNKTTR